VNPWADNKLNHPARIEKRNNVVKRVNLSVFYAVKLIKFVLSEPL
jgi:hypothetical protein